MSSSQEVSGIPFTTATEDGPLYPPVPIPHVADLTNNRTATGTPLLLHGQVFDYRMRPVPNAQVEIWQTDANGYYTHPRAIGPDALDPYWAITEQDLDPNFRYFGAVETDPAGAYAFQTIVPRWYHVFGTDRAAHIHMKIRSLQNGVLTTEIYFSGVEQEGLRNRDAVFSRHSATAGLVVELTPNNNAEGLVCNRDIRFY